MQPQVVPAAVVRFASFEANLRSGELRKSGIRLKLPDQSFQVLRILLEHAGEVVSREELQRQLWPADTFVDFDHGLNMAVKRVRDALGDSAENPRFIETLARRGYRFLHPVSFTANSTRTALFPLSVVGAKGATPKLRTYLLLSAIALLAISGAAWWIFGSAARSSPKVLRYVRITNDGAPKMMWFYPSSIVSDGLRVYFGESDWPTGRFAMAQASVDGGEVSLIPVPAPFELVTILDISKDRSELLVTAGKMSNQTDFPLWIIPIPGGAPRRVGSLVAHDANWTSDGHSLVYAQGSDLYYAKADGSESRRLADLPSGKSAWWPRWSPNGRVVRFSIWDDSTRSGSLWEVSSDGSGLHRLFPRHEDNDECCGRWTPDGKYFIFQSTQRGLANLWTYRETAGRIHWNTEPVQLTSGTMSLMVPFLSADGKRLFVVGSQRRGELMRYDKESRQFVTFLGGISAEGVSFSKDGAWVAYVSYPEGTLWRSRADGAERLQLTGAEMRVSLPRWSPDGKWVVFLGSNAGGIWNIYRLPASGGSAELLVGAQGALDDPNWSPDGKMLVFGNNYMGPDLESIHLLDLETRRVSVLAGSKGLYSPRWSPDGRYIAGMTQDSRKLLLYDFKTQRWRTLLEDRFFAYPAWSHDGQYLYFSCPFERDTPFYRLRISDRALEKVVDVKVARNLAIGAWTGLAPDDSPMLLRDASLQEIYALDLQLP